MTADALLPLGAATPGRRAPTRSAGRVLTDRTPTPGGPAETTQRRRPGAGTGPAPRAGGPT